MTDSDLLRRYAQRHDSSAFTELAKRHLDFVYATARRLLHGDAHGAQDVCQQVFIDLARKAPDLVAHPCLAGWLHACTRFNAVDTLRRDHRRLLREHAADAMNETLASAADWDRIRPLIDDALEELDERDRHFVLLRFFHQQSFAAIAQQFQVSENTVQKAVGRALDVLNAGLSRRGITSTSAALAVAMTQATTAAPAALLSTITKAALAGAAPAVPVLAALKFGAALAATSGLALGVGYWTGTQRQLAANLNETTAMERQHRVELQRLQVRIDEEKRRSATAESEISTLLTAIERARNEQQQLAAAASRAAAAAAAAQVRAIPVGPDPYVIKPGDGGPRIAASQGVTVAELAAANPGVNWARLRVGQQINLPPRSQPRDAVSPATSLPDLSSAFDFVVRPGDTIGAILVAARVTLADIQRLNPDLAADRLVAGQRIRLR